MVESTPLAPFEPDADQARVLEHERGPLLVTGADGTGKSAALLERFARLIEGGADPERVALVVGSRPARARTREAALRRLRSSLPALRITTLHGLAYQVVSRRHEALQYGSPPEVLSAADQFARVRELLLAEDPADWPTYGSMLQLRGFADQVRQFLLRAQEALLSPEEISERAARRGLGGWDELAAFHRRYLQALDGAGLVDFAGMVEQAAASAEQGPPLFDHLIVDDYQDTTFAAESLLAHLAPASLVVAGDPEAHVFAFQGTTREPLETFGQRYPTTERVELRVRHRGANVDRGAWFAPHPSEEHAAAARELRRVHQEEGVAWPRMAVVVRRQGSHVGGLLRALDEAGVPRWTPERGLSVAAETAIHPYLLALRWIARPADRAALVETVLTSELGGVPPAVARGMLRAARGSGGDLQDALLAVDGLPSELAARVSSLRDILDRAASVGKESVLDAFRVLWRELPSSARIVVAAEEDSPEARRDLDAIVAFSDLVARAGEGADPSTEAFLADLEAGHGGPGGGSADGPGPDAVHVLTAHGCAGREFDTVIVVGALEGNFPSLSRPEPMFDLAVLDGPVSQAERNRLRLADERRLLRMVVGRASRRVLFTASDRHEEAGPVARSRLVEELGVGWEPAPMPWGGVTLEPVSPGEARAGWRRALADHDLAPPERLAALEGLLALRDDPRRWWFQREWTDTGRPLHETVRVSFSRLGTLENCELQFVLSEELGLGRPSGYHAWVGHLVHTLIEDYEKGVIAERGLEALVREAEDRWRQDEFPSYAISEAFRRLVTETMLPNWFNEYERSPALAAEIRFEFEFDGATVTGYIDRIGPITAGGNRITDYKTGKPERAGPGEDNLQLGIYFVAVEECEDLAPYRPVRAVELAFLRGKEREPGRVAKVPWMPNSQSADEYRTKMRERLGGLIARVRSLSEHERYRANTAAECHFCEFKSLCPLWPQGAPLFPEPLGRRTLPLREVTS